ncbi:C4-dicarboxylate TRAP transporter substrate-binding protein [Rhodovibrionaceae bacterium A322]
MKYSGFITKTLAAGLLSLAVAAPLKAETVLTFTDQSPNRGTRAKAMMWFGDQLEQRTNGEVKVEFHWGGALLKAKAASKGIGDGAADMGFIVAVYNPKLHHNYLMSDLPTEYSDPWVGTRAVYEMATTDPAMKAEFDKLNLHYVTNTTTGPIQLVCKDKVVKSVLDVDGLKIRGISIYGKVFKDLGATPVAMSAYDTYQGLDTGLIECTQFYGYAIPAFKLEEVANQVTKLDWGALQSLGIVMNKDVYESLTPEQQKVVDDLGSEFIDYYAEQLIAGNAEAFEKIVAGINGNKMTVTDLSDAGKAGLLKAGQSYITSWKEKAGSNGDALFDSYMAALKKYEDERQAKGYPWTR